MFKINDILRGIDESSFKPLAKVIMTVDIEKLTDASNIGDYEEVGKILIDSITEFVKKEETK